VEKGIMTDTLNVINKTIEEHHKIREHLKHTGDSVTDIEALFALNQASAMWSQSSIQDLKEKQKQLFKAIDTLEQGLKRHFGFEEKGLPPLLGEVLMKSIIQEHGEITGLIEQAKANLAEAVPEGLAQTELLARKAKIQDIIHNIVQGVEEHAKHEETILKMIKKALESSASSSG
jgi:hemerythrin